MEHPDEKHPSPSREEMIGADVGPYQIVEKLGEGGMGVVFKAVDRALQREVALKILFEIDDEQNVKRFLQEARALAKITHPNAIHIFWIGEYDGYPCFAMEYISDGVSVYELLRHKGVLPLEDSIDMVIEAAKGLNAARRAGIVHRDVKPNNLLIDADGTVKISDFGLAKIVDGDSALTQSGIVMGTPYYMSPEQGQGEAIDHRSDLYSLGATFYHMITGFTPYEAQNPVSLIIKHVKEPIPDIRQVNPEIPDNVRRIVETCLEKNPDDRYQEYDELIEDLEAARAGQQLKNAEMVRPRRGAAGGKMPAWVYFVSGLALAGAAAAGIGLLRGDDTIAGVPTPGAGTATQIAIAPTPQTTVSLAPVTPAPTPEPGELERARAEMASSDSALRGRAAATFGKLGNEGAVPDLVKMSSGDPDARVRARAVWALGRIRSPQGSGAIVAALSDADHSVTRAAVGALDGIQDVKMVEPLKRIAAKHPDPMVRLAAADAVDRVFLEGPDERFGDQPGTWWRGRFRDASRRIATLRLRAEDAERTIRWHRQRYGFAAGDKTPPAGTEADAKRAFGTTYAAATDALSRAQAELRAIEAEKQKLNAAADAAKVPADWRR